MAVENVNGVEHVYAPNPKMQGENWVAEYPPVVTQSPWLVNKYTGEIVPNTPEFARRSDILEPYLGELPRDGMASQPVQAVNAVLADTDEQPSGLQTL